MFFVLLLKSADGNYQSEAYQVTDHDAGQAPVVFSAGTLEECISWLEAEGGETWHYQKIKIRWFTIQIGAEAVWHFQEALQQSTGLTTYEATAAQYPELDLKSFNHTRILLNGWSYATLQLIGDHLDHAYDRMVEEEWEEEEEEDEALELAPLSEQASQQTPNQTQTKPKAQARRPRKPYRKPLKRKQWS